MMKTMTNFSVEAVDDVKMENAKEVLDMMLKEVSERGKRVNSILDYYAMCSPESDRERDDGEVYYHSSVAVESFKELYHGKSMDNMSVHMHTIPCDGKASICSVQLTVNGKYILLSDSTGWDTSFIKKLAMVSAQAFYGSEISKETMIVGSNSRVPCVVPYEEGFSMLKQCGKFYSSEEVLTVMEQGSESTWFYNQGEYYGRIDFRHNCNSFCFGLQK